jgi:hypothetical protein
MEITEQAIHLLAKVASDVQARFTDFSDLAHGFEHVQRVYHLACQLETKGVIMEMRTIRNVQVSTTAATGSLLQRRGV